MWCQFDFSERNSVMSWVNADNKNNRTMSKKELKICVLCDALNHKSNRECFMCGWQGMFSKDAALVHLAWERIFDECECVLITHVTSTRKPPLGELGITKTDSTVRQCVENLARWWKDAWTRQPRPDARRRSHNTGTSVPPTS